MYSYTCTLRHSVCLTLKQTLGAPSTRTRTHSYVGSLSLSLSHTRARARAHTHTHTHTHSHSSPRASLGDCEFPQKLPTIDYSCFPLIASWVFVCLGKGAKARGVLNLRVLKARLG